MQTYQSRNPRADVNPLRSLPLYKSAARVLGWSELEKARYALTTLEMEHPVHEARMRNACAALGLANRCPAPAMRRMRQADAMREINMVRAAQRRAVVALAKARARMAALTAPAVPAAPAVRVLAVAVNGYEAGSTAVVGACAGWGWHATVTRPDKAGIVVSTHPTREAAEAWLAAELPAAVLH